MAHARVHAPSGPSAGRRPRALAAAAAWVVFGMLSGCKPAGVSDAEAKGNVAWLDQQTAPEATGALGRLADKNPKAQAALEAKPKNDLNVYLAAWAAVERGAAWGPRLIRRGLSDASTASVASRAMTRKSPKLTSFVGDLEGAVKAGCSECTGVLASAGATASPAVERRLADAATRGAMCQGLASVDATHEVRMTFTTVPVASRDDQRCLGAAAQMAAIDDDVLSWLGSSAETGLLGGASKSETLPCARLRRAWDLALKTRPKAQYAALAVPLEAAVERCGKALDETLAGALEANVTQRALAVDALDTPSSNVRELRSACQALRKVRSAGLPARSALAAADALVRCANAGSGR